jgi:outer membrane receptor for ferrienterochelin and colicin
MIGRVPGFTFDAGQSIRGFEGAAGNVLIDGQRPSTKDETLDHILKRIPVRAVARIDVIRGSAPGIDMHGQSVVANIIRNKGARTEASATIATNAYSDRRFGPTFDLNVARSNGDHLLSSSLRLYKQEGDEHGTGTHTLTDGTGSLIDSSNAYRQDEDRGLQLRANAQEPLGGGLAHLNLAFDRTATDQAEDYFRGSSPGNSFDSTIDLYRRIGGEIGGDYSRDLGSDTKLMVVALQSLRRRRHDSSSISDSSVDDFSELTTQGESILRASATRTFSDKLTAELGTEGAYNFLNGTSALSLGGQPIDLPNANARVRELRGEGFVAVNWQATKKFGVEAGLRTEASTIRQVGGARESFLFPKPRLLLTWSVSDTTQIRARVEREVGQLDFLDFAPSVDLATGVVLAGNAHLQPERRWIYEVALDRTFWGSGEFVVTLRHSALQELIDFVPVEGFNAPGNIGNGTRETVIADLSLPLTRLGMKNGLLKGNVQWQTSRVTDPTTGQRREISLDHPLGATLTLSNDLAKLKSSWSIAFDSGYRERSFYIDDIETVRRLPAVTLTWDYTPTPHWAFEAQIANPTRNPRDRLDQVYNGLRSPMSLASNEDLRVRIPSALYLRVRWQQ